MTNEEKVNRIQSVIDHPGNEGLYYKLLEDMGDLKHDYGDYMTTAPINCDIELKRLPMADYDLATALLTMLLREDHFSNGSFERRQRAGQVDSVLNRMIETLAEDVREQTHNDQHRRNYKESPVRQKIQ